MDTTLFVQMFVNGTMLGAQLALFATGLTLVYGIMQVINFAHGEIYMLGAFFVFLLTQELGLNYFGAIILSMLFVAGLGVIIERLFFKPMRGENIPSFIMSVGLIYILQTIAVLAFGVKDRAMPSVFPGLIHILGATVPVERLAVIVVSGFLIAGFYLFLYKSKTGRTMRCITQDPEAAALLGVNIDQISSIAMAIGASLAAAAGGLLAPVLVLNPFMGGRVVWEGFIAVVLGGRTSLIGTLIAVFIIGYVKSFVSTLVDPVVAMMVEAAVLAVVLIVKPQGILGNA